MNNRIMWPCTVTVRKLFIVAKSSTKALLVSRAKQEVKATNQTNTEDGGLGRWQVESSLESNQLLFL